MDYHRQSWITTRYRINHRVNWGEFIIIYLLVLLFLLFRVFLLVLLFGL